MRAIRWTRNLHLWHAMPSRTGAAAVAAAVVGLPSRPVQCMRAYCPMENIRPQAYPPMLIEAGLHDTRVGYWEAAKFAQRVRAANTSDSRTLLKVEMDEGACEVRAPAGRSLLVVVIWRDTTALSFLVPRAWTCRTQWCHGPLQVPARAGTRVGMGARHAQDCGMMGDGVEIMLACCCKSSLKLFARIYALASLRLDHVHFQLPAARCQQLNHRRHSLMGCCVAIEIAARGPRGRPRASTRRPRRSPATRQHAHGPPRSPQLARRCQPAVFGWQKHWRRPEKPCARLR